MFELQEDVEIPMAQIEDPNQLKLAKRQSFKPDTIEQWNALQENLQLQYNLLNKENETKAERIQNLVNTVEKYQQTLLRYKDIRRAQSNNQINYNQKQCILGYKFDMVQSEVQKFMLLLMDNQDLFAQLIHSSLDVGTHNLEEFIFDILTFLYDPIVGAGLQEGVFKLLSELLKLELINLKHPLELFTDKNNLVCKYLVGFTKGPLCQAYLQQVCGQAVNLLMNVKEELELNSKTIYETQLRLKESRESAKNMKLKQEEKRRKNILTKITYVFMTRYENDETNVYDNVRKSKVPDEQLKKIITQITPAIQSYCQTPLMRVVDPQLVEETASILYDRRTVTEMILNSLCDNLVNTLHKLPFIMKALCKLQHQIFKVLNQNMKQEEINLLLLQFIINKWVIPEFTAMFLNQQSLEQSQYQMSNITQISKMLISVWKGEQLEGLNITLTQVAVNEFFKGLIELPQTHLNYYIKDKQDKHFVCYLLSLQDLQILLATVSKSCIEGSLGGKQLLRYTEMKDLAGRLIGYSKNNCDYMNNQILWKGTKVAAANLHFSVQKFSDIYQVNYVETAFKFTEIFGAADKEELLFISKAKQVVAQFLICIERISLLAKLRHNVILSFDNLIFMYKDSYDNKGQIIKQYENISAQLYANYLLSIYKMIPIQYTSNNLSLLCSEMNQEFDKKVKFAKNQQKAMLETYLRVITQLQTERNEIKALNKMLKLVELKKKLNYFVKNVKIPCLFGFRFGQVSLTGISDISKIKSLDPKDQEKQQFLKILNEVDLKSVQLELTFQNIRDFIDIMSGIKPLQLAMNGDQIFVEMVSKIFQQYMKILEEKLEQQSFFIQDVTQGKYYQKQCYQYIEKALVKRILLKYCTANEIQIDKEFMDQCNKKLQGMKEQPEVMKCLSELPILQRMSEQLRQIDSLYTPLEKLELIAETQTNIARLLQISGLEDNPGQDSILPIFLYLVAQACPRYMKTNQNIIKCLFNQERWKNSSLPFMQTQLESAIQTIQS